MKQSHLDNVVAFTHDENSDVNISRNIEVNDDSNKNTWLNDFLAVYQILDKENLHLLKTIYHENVIFIDPMHHVEGQSHLIEYFSHLYTNLLSCDFMVNEVVQQGNNAAIYWDMTYQHPKLRSGQPVVVQGHSLLKMLDNKVVYHRDYVDIGAMLYEHIPVVGRVIKSIKRRASQ